MQQQRMLLKAEAILKYFLGTSEKIETLVMCKPNHVDLVCHDQALYEAFGSLQGDERTQALAKLTKFLENVSIRNSQRAILKEEKVTELRKLATKDNGTEKEN